MPYANNKDTDQTVESEQFLVVRSVDNIIHVPIHVFAISKISRL